MPTPSPDINIPCFDGEAFARVMRPDGEKEVRMAMTRLIVTPTTDINRVVLKINGQSALVMASDVIQAINDCIAFSRKHY